MTMRAALVLAGLLAAAPAAATEHDPHIQREPTPVAPDHDPCHLFETEDEFVSFDLDTGEEKVPLRAPAVYFEDPWDFEQGATHGAQLFRVGIADFVPVTRRESTRRMKAGNRNWMTILLTRSVPLRKAAQIRAQFDSGMSDQALDEFETVNSDHGLVRLVFQKMKPRAKEHYHHFHGDALKTLITCSRDGQVPSPNCELFYEHETMRVIAVFYKAELPNWRRVRDRVERFITCMREASRQ